MDADQRAFVTEPTLLSFGEVQLSEVPFGDFTEAGHARDPFFGGKKLADEIDFRRLKVSVGNRPLSWRLRALFKRAGKVLPSGMKLYRNWDVWMIAHAVSVSDRGEFATLLSSVVDAVGYEAEFQPSLAATIALHPEAALVRNVGGKLEVSVDIGLDGSAQMSDIDGSPPQFDEAVPLLAGAKLGFSVKTQLFGRLTFGVWTPKVVTMGLCSCKAEWLFNRIDAPLRNSQLMFQTVLVPAGVDTLSFKCRAYALIRSVGFIPIPSRFETKWLDVSTSPVADLK